MNWQSWKFIAYLKDYCANCTLAGVGYIANQNLHFTERIFWLTCLILSALGSYHLISQFEKDFESKAVSIVYASLPYNEKLTFPSLALCNMFVGNEMNPDIEQYVGSLDPDDYNYDVESAVLFAIFPYTYSLGFMKSRCGPYEACTDCVKCPRHGYRRFLEEYGVNCSDYFVSCSFSGKPFDCCQYFQPLITAYGECFMLNSVQNNVKGSATWLNLDIDPIKDSGVMDLTTKGAIQLRIINEEDIPHTILPSLATSIEIPGQHKTLQVYIENMRNDADVRDVSPQFRKCRFPDEVLPTSVYKAYSFSACLLDCIRTIQLRICDCTPFVFMPDDATRDCGVLGYMCLENQTMLDPDIKTFLPWVSSNYTCECLPSCAEHDLRLVYETSAVNRSSTHRRVSISMAAFPTERYRRQALRTSLDVVVTIGGIMGLFMGASILSGIELLYYFTLRIYNNMRRTNNVQSK